MLYVYLMLGVGFLLFLWGLLPVEFPRAPYLSSSARAGRTKTLLTTKKQKADAVLFAGVVLMAAGVLYWIFTSGRTMVWSAG